MTIMVMVFGVEISVAGICVVHEFVYKLSKEANGFSSPPSFHVFSSSSFAFCFRFSCLICFWYAMEGKNHHSSSSSFTELFGSKEPSASSSFFNSIFPPPSKVQGTEKNYDFANKRDSTDKEDKSLNPKTDMNPLYQQQKSHPCHLSSSIYYGGQDVYTNPPVTKNSSQHSTYNQEGEDDGRASRGNWWQGSLYY
ncbi:hypothetical protein L2E82_12739 [Cichorium intybus]|uniref:Uncharacterized protein n=1 Tax=Cichorium intybus TaxID=13427 RepID=A0ACB9GGX3_CICIN|nr:hypothetical protein L2E82_12739 [Cichorium intybus]